MRQRQRPNWARARATPAHAASFEGFDLEGSRGAAVDLWRPSRTRESAHRGHGAREGGVQLSGAREITYFVGHGEIGPFAERRVRGRFSGGQRAVSVGGYVRMTHKTSQSSHMLEALLPFYSCVASCLLAGPFLYTLEQLTDDRPKAKSGRNV